MSKKMFVPVRVFKTRAQIQEAIVSIAANGSIKDAFGELFVKDIETFGPYEDADGKMYIPSIFGTGTSCPISDCNVVWITETAVNAFQSLLGEMEKHPDCNLHQFTLCVSKEKSGIGFRALCNMQFLLIPSAVCESPTAEPELKK